MKEHILVVDDELPIRELLQSYFTKHGYEVSTAWNGEEGLRSVGDRRPDLVILDVLMPDRDGMDILEKLKETHPTLPVIILTALGQDEDLLQEAIQKGASRYLSKTLPLDELLMEVHRTLKPKRAAK